MQCRMKSRAARDLNLRAENQHLLGVNISRSRRESAWVRHPSPNQVRTVLILYNHQNLLRKEISKTRQIYQSS